MVVQNGIGIEIYNGCFILGGSLRDKKPEFVICLIENQKAFILSCCILLLKLIFLIFSSIGIWLAI